MLNKFYFDYLFTLGNWSGTAIANLFDSQELKLEPLSIISIILQLANVSPEVNKFLKNEENLDLTRTQVIELYRSNMKSNIIKRSNN